MATQRLAGRNLQPALDFQRAHDTILYCSEFGGIRHAPICESFITQWDFDGTKYDLFNCVTTSPSTRPNRPGQIMPNAIPNKLFGDWLSHAFQADDRHTSSTELFEVS